ncbi:DUF3120 domain-containing protein [filamentous cyanobacterium CCP5]|nr:DUF3120 domain-containing protein [filamentous cyanobacterium CCP5]
MRVAVGLAGLRSWLAFHRQRWQVMAYAVGLVTIPVFFQAPLVRTFPWLSLWATFIWLGLGTFLERNPKHALWGDLLVGFTWSWLAGTIYWGWLRWEPVVHMPVEAIALPIVAVCLWKNWCRIGSYFYLGSLLGTAVTDLYINWMGLFPAWRRLMAAEPDTVSLILREAADSLQTDFGACRAMVLTLFLLLASLIPLLTSRHLFWWAFSGALLSTLAVDGLFFISACFA